ncbi:MAG: hypothetical protein V3V99_00935 [candidate division Zixibacteria bacterium]
MEKDCCQVKVTEIDNGFRIEVTGDNVKSKFAGCCGPMMGVMKMGTSECCPGEQKEKAGECCPEENKDK